MRRDTPRKPHIVIDWRQPIDDLIPVHRGPWSDIGLALLLLTEEPANANEKNEITDRFKTELSRTLPGENDVWVHPYGFELITPDTQKEVLARYGRQTPYAPLEENHYAIGRVRTASTEDRRRMAIVKPFLSCRRSFRAIRGRDHVVNRGRVVGPRDLIYGRYDRARARADLNAYTQATPLTVSFLGSR